MSGSGPSISIPVSGDRRPWLIAFGTVEILLGAIAALFIPVVLVAQLLATRLPPAGSESQSAAGTLSILLLLAGSAVGFVWIGIGTIRARRWARSLILVVSWIWLLTGAIFAIAVLLAVPFLDELWTAGSSPDSGAIRLGVAVLLGVPFALGFLALPLAFILFARSPGVRRTFEARDPAPRWTDRCPSPVLTWSLLLGVLAFLSLGSFENPVFPLFGHILTGIPAACVILANVLILAFLGWECYLLRMSGWWGSIVFFVMLPIANALAFRRVSLLRLYQAMGAREDLVEALKPMEPYVQACAVPAVLALTAANLAYLLWIRKLFVAAEAARKAGGGARGRATPPTRFPP